MRDERHADTFEAPRERLRPRSWSGQVFALAGLLGCFVTGGVLLSAPSADAGWFGARCCGHWGHHRDAETTGAHTERAVAWVLDEVAATSDQKQRVKAIADVLVDDLSVLGEQHRRHRRDLVAALSQPAVDRAALERIRREELELASTASEQIVAALADMADVLTPEQRDQLLQMAERFHH